MIAKTHNQTALTNSLEPRWPFTVWMSRAFMAPPALIFLLISFKFFTNPARAIAANGVAFTGPEAMTDARVMGAIILALAIFIFTAIFSKTRLRFGHFIVVITMGLILAVRLYGFMADGTTLEMGHQMQKTIGEIVFLVLNSIGLIVQTIRSKPASAVLASPQPASA